MKELEKQTYQDGVSIAAAYLRGMNTYPMPEDPEQSRANRAELASLARSVDTYMTRGDGINGRKLLDKIDILLFDMTEEMLDPTTNPFPGLTGADLRATKNKIREGLDIIKARVIPALPPFGVAKLISEAAPEGEAYAMRVRAAAIDLETLLEGQGKTYAGRKLANLNLGNGDLLGNSDLRGLPAVLATVAYNLGFASIYLFGQGRAEGEPYVERASKVLNSLAAD